MMLNRKTLDCGGACDLMFDYIDGVISESDAARLEAHLEGCEACRRELDERREMLALVKSSAAAVPSALYGRVMAEVEKTPQDKKMLTPKLRLKPWMGSLAAVAAAVMILVVGRGFLSQSTEMLDNEPSGARSYFDAAPAPADENDAIDVGAPDKAQYSIEDIYGSVSEDRITETTASYEGFAPALPVDTEAKTSCGDVVSTGEGADSAVLDAIFAAHKTDDVALLVCTKTALDGVIPAGLDATSTLDGIFCEHYVLDSDAIVKFTGYLEVLEHRHADYRAHVPTGAEFEKCEIILVANDSE